MGILTLPGVKTAPPDAGSGMTKVGEVVPIVGAEETLKNLTYRVELALLAKCQPYSAPAEVFIWTGVVLAAERTLLINSPELVVVAACLTNQGLELAV